MIKHDKKDGNYIEIPAVFTNSSGVIAEPGTSFKIYIYPANSETAVVNGNDLDKVESTSTYSYTWDISSVSAGNYYGFIIAVDNGNSYPTAINIDITDTSNLITNIVNGVLDEALSGHTTSGTVGYTINTINTETTSLKNTIDTNIDTKVSLAGSGNGGITQPIYVNDVDGTREGGVKVEVFSNPDMAEANRISGNRFTDDAGQVVFNLNPGTYYLRASKSGKTFANPITITVSE